jgi:hypothetical protein
MGDGAEIVHEFLSHHSNASVGNGQGIRILVRW